MVLWNNKQISYKILDIAHFQDNPQITHSRIWDKLNQETKTLGKHRWFWLTWYNKICSVKEKKRFSCICSFSITVTFLNYRNWILHPICENTLLGWEPRLHYRTEWPEWQNEEWVVRVTSVITIENLYYHLN